MSDNDKTPRANGAGCSLNVQAPNTENPPPSPASYQYTPSYPVYQFTPSATPAYSPPERRKLVPIRVHCDGILDKHGTITIILIDGEGSDIGLQQVQEALSTFVLAKFYEAGYERKHDFINVQLVKGIWSDGKVAVLDVRDNITVLILNNLIDTGGALDVTVSIGINVDADGRASENVVARREESVVSQANEDGGEGASNPQLEDRSTFWE